MKVDNITSQQWQRNCLVANQYFNYLQRTFLQNLTYASLDR